MDHIKSGLPFSCNLGPDTIWESNDEAHFLMSDLLPASSPVAKLLLDKGFNPSGQDLRKSEALLCAAEYGPADIVQLLVDEGADVDAKEPVFGFNLPLSS